jgi:superfamily II DNA or RNA helicase
MKRKLILRDYQVPAEEHIKTSNKCVLAIAPNGGKTEISIKSIENFLTDNPNGKVLVLAHSTNVLLMNFYDRLLEIDVPFTYSKVLTDDTQVHITIPQNEDKIVNQYDYVIIDEAHENYLADRVPRILDKVRPQKELLLTATPSKFIAAKTYDIYAIAANEISDEWFAKLNLELVASNYNWTGNYNADQEVKKSFEFTEGDTEKTLEVVLDKLITRLKTGFKAKEFNHPSMVTKFKSWAFTYENIGKTMITCKTIKQAESTNKILQDKGVDSRVSHSENDKDSDIIVDFKNNEFNVLVVVNRGRLGYNDNDLLNLIDMSGTHNPDVIYQMFCRVVRGTPDIEKFFVKVTPKELHNMSRTHISVCAALMLTDRRYLTEYNGKNFGNWEIPVFRRRPTVTIEGDEDDVIVRRRRTNYGKNYLPDFTHDIIDTMRDVLYDANNVASIYKMTTIREVRYELGHSTYRPPMTYEQLLESAMGLA